MTLLCLWMLENMIIYASNTRPRSSFRGHMWNTKPLLEVWSCAPWWRSGTPPPNQSQVVAEKHHHHEAPFPYLQPPFHLILQRLEGERANQTSHDCAEQHLLGRHLFLFLALASRTTELCQTGASQPEWAGPEWPPQDSNLGPIGLKA